MPTNRVLVTRTWYQPDKYEDDTEEEVGVLNWLDETVIKLTWILGQIVSTRSDPGAMIFDYQFATTRLEALGHMVFDLSVNEPSCVDRSIIEITKMIDANKSLTRIIRDGSSIKNVVEYKFQ